MTDSLIPLPLRVSEMAKKKNSQLKDSVTERSEQIDRKSLPEELEVRLRVVWSKVGHLVEWCDDSTSWMKMFCAEARPYRETFYWEAVAEMVFDYMSAHQRASAERTLTDCLIATQCSPSANDSDRMVHFRTAWQQVLNRSRDEIEGFIKSDLDLAMQDGTYETVARLYAADYSRWEKGKEASERP